MNYFYNSCPTQQPASVEPALCQSMVPAGAELEFATDLTTATQP